MRIHVTGNAGAGKTTMARHLAGKFNLPVYHLDKIVWSSHWTKPPPERRAAEIATLTSNNSWVIDGVSEQVRNDADVVIVLTTPRYKCMYRCIKRCFQFGFRTRPELPANCPEIAILFHAIKLVWRFQKRIGHELIAESKRNDNYLVCDDTATVGLSQITKLAGQPR